MNETVFMDLTQNAIWLVILLSAPLLAVNLVVGLGISIFQAVTQIQESTLTFVPKILASFLAIVLMGPWMTRMLVEYSGKLFEDLIRIAQMHH